MEVAMLKKFLWSAGFIGLGCFALFLTLQMPSDRGACSNGADWIACLRGTTGSQAQLQANPYN